MASTNKTQYFELSQFIGGDKPTWLGDINGDMLKIDNALHTIKSTADNADASATTAGTNALQALSDASDANTLADTANTNANQALSKSNNNENKINEMSKFSTTEEVVIGEFLGKPLYRKVFSTTETLPNYTSTSSTLDINTGLTNLDVVFIENAFLNGSNICTPIPTNETAEYSSRGSMVTVEFSKYQNQIRLLSKEGGYNTNWTKVIILNYTKTTD